MLCQKRVVSTYEREQQDKGMKISQLCFPIFSFCFCSRNLAAEHTFCTGFVILFEIMWNNAPSHSHSLSHTLHILYIFYEQAKTWYHLHLSVRNADNSDITILPTRIIFVLPARPAFSLIDTVGRRGRRNCPSRRWLDKSKRSINAVTDPPVGFWSWDEEVQ